MSDVYCSLTMGKRKILYEQFYGQIVEHICYLTEEIRSSCPRGSLKSSLMPAKAQSLRCALEICETMYGRQANRDFIDLLEEDASDLLYPYSTLSIENISAYQFRELILDIVGSQRTSPPSIILIDRDLPKESEMILARIFTVLLDRAKVLIDCFLYRLDPTEIACNIYGLANLDRDVTAYLYAKGSPNSLVEYAGIIRW